MFLELNGREEQKKTCSSLVFSCQCEKQNRNSSCMATSLSGVLPSQRLFYIVCKNQCSAVKNDLLTVYQTLRFGDVSSFQLLFLRFYSQNLRLDEGFYLKNTSRSSVRRNLPACSGVFLVSFTGIFVRLLEKPTSEILQSYSDSEVTYLSGSSSSLCVLRCPPRVTLLQLQILSSPSLRGLHIDGAGLMPQGGNCRGEAVMAAAEKKSEDKGEDRSRFCSALCFLEGQSIVDGVTDEDTEEEEEVKG